MFLPSSSSALRQMFSIEDVVQIKSNPASIPSLRDATCKCRKFLAGDKKAKSVNTIARVSNGDYCLIEVKRQSFVYLWNFSKGITPKKNWVPS
jgi:hypothetical protein